MKQFLALLCATTASIVVSHQALAVTPGWQPLAEGGLEYIIQVAPQQIDSFRTQGFSSEVPPDLRDIRRITVRVGTDPVPHHGEVTLTPEQKTLINTSAREPQPGASSASDSVYAPDKRSAVATPAPKTFAEPTAETPLPELTPPTISSATGEPAATSTNRAAATLEDDATSADAPSPKNLSTPQSVLATAPAAPAAPSENLQGPALGAPTGSSTSVDATRPAPELSGQPAVAPSATAPTDAATTAVETSATAPVATEGATPSPAKKTPPSAFDLDKLTTKLQDAGKVKPASAEAPVSNATRSTAAMKPSADSEPSSVTTQRVTGQPDVSGVAGLDNMSFSGWVLAGLAITLVASLAANVYQGLEQWGLRSRYRKLSRRLPTSDASPRV